MIHYRLGICREHPRIEEAPAAKRLDPESASVRYVRARVLRALGRKQRSQAGFAASTRLRQSVRGRLEKDAGGRAAEPQSGRE